MKSAFMVRVLTTMPPRIVGLEQVIEVLQADPTAAQDALISAGSP